MLGVGPAAPAFAADEGKIAVVTSNGGADSIRVIDPNGAPISTLLSRPYDVPRTAFAYTFPTWSPDAQRIAYSNPNVNMWGGVRLEPGGALTPADTTGIPAWSPKSNEIAHWAYTPQGYVIRIIKADGSGGRTVAGAGPLPFGGGAPAWSPDGKKLAYSAGAGLRHAGILYEIPAEGGFAKVLVPMGADGSWTHAPAYSPDGKKIAYFRERFGPQSSFRKLVVRDLATANEQPVTEVANPSDSTETISWSPDGKRIAYPEGAPFCGVGDGSNPLGCDLVTIKVDGSEKKTILHADQYLRHPSWSRPPLPNYYVKHIEVAQAIAPDLPPLEAVDPLATDPIGFDWHVTSVAGFTIPLVAEKSTLVRVYVGDSSLDAGKAEERYVRYSITGSTLSQPVERLDNVRVTAPDVAPTQTEPVAALNVWLPPSVARSGSPVRLDVELNTEQDKPECDGCHPNGNKAFISGTLFEDGGIAGFVPVPIYVKAPDGSQVEPKSHFEDVFALSTQMLPVGDAGVRIVDSPVHLTVDADDLKPGVLDYLSPVKPIVTQLFACEALLARLEELRLMTPPVTLAPGTLHWAGLASHPLATESCAGLANKPGLSLVLTDAQPDTTVHEFGHNLGLSHTLGYGDVVPGNAFALPYIGIGGAGYENFADFLEIHDKLRWGDVMSYSQYAWTSPSTWHQMFDAILGESGASSAGSAARPSAAARATVSARRSRRLASGFIVGGEGVLLRSIVADAAKPIGFGRVIGRVVARDRGGHKIATVKVRGNTSIAPDETLPFTVSLPASKRVASLVLLPSAGRKPLARLAASRHAPVARFVRVPKRASARKRLKVPWRASDRDRDNLSVVLLAKRGRRPWETVAMGPARHKATVDPRALGSGKRLRLRLLVSDGFNTTATMRSLGLKR
ncbi:MAG TPA: hypothetical protein VF056_00160 [Thermoleophilaceae bacterium]